MISQITATVIGGMLKPDEKLEFADQTRVNLTIEPLRGRIEPSKDRGSPAAILGTLAQTPTVNSKDVDELERLIEAGKRPLASRNPLLPKRRGKKA
jgi:hypothetical protein